MRRKIDVIAVGPQKTATTWLYEQLKNFDELSFPKGVKETFYWDNVYSGRNDDWYFSHFNNLKKTIEIAPTYFDSSNAMERIKQNNSNTKIIITIRSPITRSYSLYLHHMRKGRYDDNTGFFDASKRISKIIEASHYKKHIENWIQQFGIENVLLLFQEDIKKNPSEVLRNIEKFLGIKLDFSLVNLNTKINEASTPKSFLLAKMATSTSLFLRKYKLYGIINFSKNIGLKKFIYESKINKSPLIDKELFLKLVKVYAEDILYLENISSRDLSHWKRYEAAPHDLS